MLARFFSIVMLATPLFLAACGGSGDGPQLASVSGKVTFDGQPLSDASVEFAPIEVEQVEEGVGGSGGNAATDESGKYTVRTGSQFGLQPGKYLVRIAKTSYDDDGQEMQQIPARYNTESDLEVTIESGGNSSLDFKLESE